MDSGRLGGVYFFKIRAKAKKLYQKGDRKKCNKMKQ
jgi:hypothetical protein